MKRTPARVHLFLCGDALRGDDGAARAILRALPPSVRLSAHLHEQPAVSVDDLLELPAGAVVVIVDTVVGVLPGRLVAFDLRDLPLRAAACRPRSTHQLPLDQVVDMAILFGSGLTGSFVGVGGADFRLGMPLSGPVRRAIPALAAAVGGEVTRLLAPAPSSGVAA